MSNILGHNGAPLAINGAPITCASAGTDTSDATISSNSQLLYPYTSYGDGIKYTGSIQSQAAQTIYPSTSDQTISSGVYLSGTQTVKGVTVSNLTAANIKNGVTIEIGDTVDSDRITSITGSYVAENKPVKDVNFMDYDGTILYSYTAAEFAQLTSMPPNPTHDRLTAQGWNWSLSDAKAYVSKNEKLWIGQMYITSSGNTEVDFSLEAPGQIQLQLYIQGTITIDWGDGSNTQTASSSSNSSSELVSTPHTYSTTGNYTISIGVDVVGGNYFWFYQGYLLDPYGLAASGINKIFLGNTPANVIYHEAFQNTYGLEYITIPNHITTIGDSAFYYCHSLKVVVLPDSLTQMGDFDYCYALSYISIPNSINNFFRFYDCYSLQYVTIPEKAELTTISNSQFEYCYSLKFMIIPETITSIGNYNFWGGLQKIVFKSTTPPTVSSNSAFYLQTGCKIYVPSGSLSAYISATNYPSSSTYTYIEV